MAKGILSYFRLPGRHFICLPLMVLLLMFTVDMVVMKIVGLFLVFLLNPNLRLKGMESGIPLFYLLVSGLEVLKFLGLNDDHSAAHFITVMTGCFFWMLAMLALVQIRSILQGYDMEVIERTLMVFFIINVLISVLQLVMAMYESGSLNPFALSDVRFGTSTGDRIKGTLLGPSYLNMMVNSLYIFYFVFRKRFLPALAAMLVVALTCSNFANLVLVSVMVIAMILVKGWYRKLSFLSLLVLLAIFYGIAAHANLKYVRDSVLGHQKQQQEFLAYQHEAAGMQTGPVEENSIQDENVSEALPVVQASQTIAEYRPERVDQMLADSNMLLADTAVFNLDAQYGKVIAFRQTWAYMNSGFKPLLFGAGTGSFSSLLALRMSKLNVSSGSRLFSYLPRYTAPEFEQNHYRIYRTLYSLPVVFHSIKHLPNSFASQLPGEYGLAGVLMFFVFYLWFFLKNYRKGYVIYMLMLLGGFLMFDYLFEYLSVTVFFELFMLMEIKKKKTDG